MMENIDLEKISVAVGDDVFLKYKDEIIYRATSMIDMLTRHKINVIGWDNLTPYQQKTIERCRLEIIAFLFDNIEILNMPLASYSINGVSMQFKLNSTVYCNGDIIMPRATYAAILSTGLCYGGML